MKYEYPKEVEGVQRFVIAHGIGLVVLQQLNEDYPCVMISQSAIKGLMSTREAQANEFAMALLMPPKVLRASIERDGFTDLQSLASLYGVTPSAVRWWLKVLKFL